MLLAIGGLDLVLALAIEQPLVRTVLGISALVFIGLAACFAHLRVRGLEERLEVRFGPLPLFGRSFPFAEMRSAEPARSTLIDGWGIHFVPGRGWLYNLWGRDCVRIELEGRAVRVGTDDVAGLVAFLRGRIAARGA